MNRYKPWMLVVAALIMGGCGRQDQSPAQDYAAGLNDASVPPPVMPPPDKPTVLPRVPTKLAASPKVEVPLPPNQPQVMAVNPPNAPIKPKATPAAAKVVAVDSPVQPIPTKGVTVSPALPDSPLARPAILETKSSLIQPLPGDGSIPVNSPPTPGNIASDPRSFENERINQLLISDKTDDNLTVLNEALKVWLMKNKGLPEMISDLVGEEYLPMLPMAPLGKVFTIDRESDTVVLVTDK